MRVYQPVFSQATGWILGVIDNHVAKPLDREELDRVCERLNAPLETCASVLQEIRAATETLCHIMENEAPYLADDEKQT